MISLPIWQMRSHGITKSSPWQTAERFAGTDIDNFFLAEIYNAHAVLLFTDSYGKTYAKMLLQLT